MTKIVSKWESDDKLMNRLQDMAGGTSDTLNVINRLSTQYVVKITRAYQSPSVQDGLVLLTQAAELIENTAVMFEDIVKLEREKRAILLEDIAFIKQTQT